MDQQSKLQKPWMLIACVVALSSGACTRDQVDRGVDRVSQGTHRIAEKLDVSLHNAKDEAEHLGEKLPPADKLKADIKQAGDAAQDKLEAAGSKLKTAANEARASVKRKVEGSK
jgi:hypothetical protein